MLNHPEEVLTTANLQALARLGYIWSELAVVP